LEISRHSARSSTPRATTVGDRVVCENAPDQLSSDQIGSCDQTLGVGLFRRGPRFQPVQATSLAVTVPKERSSERILAFSSSCATKLAQALLTSRPRLALFSLRIENNRCFGFTLSLPYWRTSRSRKRPSLKSADWSVGIRSWRPAGRGTVRQQRPGRWAGISTNPTIAAAAIFAGLRQTVVIPLAPRRGPSRS
jgi:hypothetical protein